MDQNTQTTTASYPFEGLSIVELCWIRKMTIDFWTERGKYPIESDLRFVKRIDAELKRRLEGKC